MSRISVALCTYNGSKFLAEQLESFLKQTRLPDEIVVGDDASTDDTAKIIETFAETAPFPVRLRINEKKLGSTKNFEETIKRCAGDLIFLSDQDDVWFDEKIFLIESVFAKNREVALIFSDAELVDENLNPLGKNLWDFTFPAKKQKDALNGKLLEVLLHQNVVTGAAMAFRSGFRQNFLPIPEDIPNLIHDGWIALAIASRAKIEFINQPLIKYRQHSSQQLGINFQPKQKKNYAERQKSFAASIDFFQNEKRRLARLKRIFEEFPQFENQRNLNSIEKFISEKQQLIEHYEARKTLPAPRAERLFSIVGEVLSGRYHRFSKGFLSAAKDLSEKW